MSESTLTTQIARLTLNPGDVLVVKSDRALSVEMAGSLAAYARKSAPEGVKVMVLGKGLSLQVLEAPKASEGGSV